MVDSPNDNSLYGNIDHEGDYGALHAIHTQDLIQMDSECMNDLVNNMGSDNKHPNLQTYEANLPRQETLFSEAMLNWPPTHYNKMPIIEEIETQYQFDVNLNGDSSGKVSWMYSAKLKKVYIKMGQIVRVYINYQQLVNTSDLFLRAMILYSNPDDMHTPVARCPNHRASAGVGDPCTPHILRCEHRQTTYMGNEEGTKFSERLSVVVPLRDIAENEPIPLLFTCQNSCSGGMNRKSTVIVFTLENNEFEILGKKLMHFKVCSCPKRDKEKEEEASLTTEQQPKPKKRKPSDAAQNHPSTSNKRPLKYVVNQQLVKTEPGVTPPPDSKIMRSVSPHAPPNFNSDSDNEKVKIELVMPNKKAMQHVLKCAYNEVSGMMTSHANGANLLPYLRNIKASQDSLEDTPLSD